MVAVHQGINRSLGSESHASTSQLEDTAFNSLPGLGQDEQTSTGFMNTCRNCLVTLQQK